jgi:hypothetical protein
MRHESRENRHYFAIEHHFDHFSLGSKIVSSLECPEQKEADYP